MKRGNYKKLILITIVVILIRLLAFNPNWVEQYYSTLLYVGIGGTFRLLFAWLPVSVGDILYFTAAIYLISLPLRLAKAIREKKVTRQSLYTTLRKCAIVIGTIYIVFNLSWGLNYNRRGIQHQLQIFPTKYEEADLVRVSDVLVTKVNETRRAAADKTYPSHSQMFRLASQAYGNAAKRYPFLRYNITSVKRSSYGKAGNYMGFSGYYNPFTGEAQVNVTLPRFLLPFVTCHEIAHQLGYASESEANFVGYLSAMHSTHPYFHYSSYLDLFSYTNRELSRRDSVKAKQNYERLDTLVKKDLHELREFYKKYKNPVEPLIWTFYDTYLKANQQDRGVESYNEVVGLLIAYYRKNGRV